jgi:hypothetical protein
MNRQQNTLNFKSSTVLTEILDQGPAQACARLGKELQFSWHSPVSARLREKEQSINDYIGC